MKFYADIFSSEKVFRILGCSELEAYSEHFQSSTMERFEKQLMAIANSASYNYFRCISFLFRLVHEINMIFLMQV